MTFLGYLLAASLMLTAPSVAAAASASPQRVEASSGGQVKIAGSSTVAPFSLALAGLLPKDILLTVDQTGTSSGLTALCSAQDSTVDIAAASRPIRNNEVRACHERGINTLTETLLGLDGIVLAQSEKSKPISLTPKDIYLALARMTPRGAGDCVMVMNRRTTWRDVRPDLPNREILVIGPPVTSGTRDMLMTLMMREGARQLPCLRSLEARSPDRLAKALMFRNDGHWLDGGENDHAIANTLLHLKYAVGVFGFSHLGETEGVVPISFDGVLPTAKTIGTGEYKATRPLYLYTTGRRLAERPAVADVLNHFFALDAIGPRGVLTGLGLVTGETVGERTVIDTQSGGRRKISWSDNMEEILSARLGREAGTPIQ